jgi:hypothetical protein
MYMDVIRADGIDIDIPNGCVVVFALDEPRRKSKFEPSGKIMHFP